MSQEGTLVRDWEENHFPLGKVHGEKLTAQTDTYSNERLIFNFWIYNWGRSSFLFLFHHLILSTLAGSEQDISSVQLLSHVQLFETPWTAARQASLSITSCRSLPKPMSIGSMIPSNHLILCGPLLSPSIFPSIRVFSNESALHIRWPKYWSFSSSISPSNEHPGLISFRMGWFGDSQESFPTPQLESINSSALSLLHSPTLTSIRDYWETIALT